MHTMDSVAAESLSAHPAYKHADADLKLMSSDGILFFVHSVILRLASPVFADMVSIPQPSNPENSDGGLETVKLTEEADVLLALLDSMYPRRPALKLESFQFVQRLACAADKYDVEDVTGTIRRFICTTSAAIIFGSTLCSYSLACRLGWEAEAKTLSYAALSANIDAPETLEVMETIEPQWVLKFLNFRRKRYTMFRDALNIYYGKSAPDGELSSRIRWEVIAARHAPLCRSTANNKTYWTALKMHLLNAFDENVTGAGLGSSMSTFWTQDRLDTIVGETCTKCHDPFFSKDGLTSEVARILEKVLPKQIE
ncbi:hypothetical protein SCHPADRAFT_686828 [Schizopora paradoxa]|uniref:BTB domain-containing protein n=1 Tax=Schizopora paradoxa TaxID=27342 RepID=A0A0H2R409_9AGAM|nr:hypothetical protein SCHPADRAFT_686828 [Schizopora paradoxa]